MIVPEEALSKYLGKKLDDLEGKVSHIVFEKLKQYEENKLNDYNFSVIDYLFLQHQKNNKSLNQLRKTVNISIHTLSKIFDVYNLPVLNKKESNIRAISEMYKDPVFRNFKINQIKEIRRKPKARKKQSEIAKKMWQNPEKKAELLRVTKEGMRRRWQEPEYRKRMTDLYRERQQKQWDDPRYRKKQTKLIINSLHEIWKNPTFKEKMSEVSRKNLTHLWNNPEFQTKKLNELLSHKYINLPSIYGYRKDIGFAKSTWEANLARIFTYCYRKFESEKVLELYVSEKYKNVFKINKINSIIDFLIIDNRGNFLLYEMLIESLKKIEGRTKLEMILEQYPNVKLRIINPESYGRLEKWFKKKINSDPRFSGWETYKDNLKTNPKKYGKE